MRWMHLVLQRSAPLGGQGRRKRTRTCANTGRGRANCPWTLTDDEAFVTELQTPKSEKCPTTNNCLMPKFGVCLLIFHTLNMHLSEPLSVVWHVELISSYLWEIRGFLSLLTIPVREFQINFSERERGGYQMTAVILLWEFPVNWLLMSFLQKQLDISHARHKTIGIMPHWCRATIRHYISDKCDCFAPH